MLMIKFDALFICDNTIFIWFKQVEIEIKLKQSTIVTVNSWRVWSTVKTCILFWTILYLAKSSKNFKK